MKPWKSHPTQGDRPHAARFNGATAMKPWKSAKLTAFRQAELHRFNGATAMKPWKRTKNPAGAHGRKLLQWGHGDEAVEESVDPSS